MNHHLIPETIRQELVALHAGQLGPPARGGLSGAWIWRCQANGHPLALRSWPPIHPTHERLHQIHLAMRDARRQGLQYVPQILDNRQGQSSTSDGQRLWELTQWMPGASDYLQHPSIHRLQSALRALATLHVTWQGAGQPTAQARGASLETRVSFPDATETDIVQNVVSSASGPSPTMSDRLERLESSLENLRTWCALTIADSTFQPLVQQTMLHLASRGPYLRSQLKELVEIPTPLHFVLRDIWSDHILFEGERVSGIIDFGAARIDEPATDVARLLGSLEAFQPQRWQIGWEAYHEVNSHVELERAILLDRVGTLLSAVQWFQWLVLERRSFEESAGRLAERWRRLLLRLEQP